MLVSNKCRGQSLLELAIALGVSSIVVAALATIITKSLQNSQFGQDQAVASQLAQAGIEQVRSIKTENGILCRSNTPTNWNDYVWGASCQVGSGDCNYKIL